MTAPEAAAEDGAAQDAASHRRGQLDWLLDDLVERVPAIRHALVLSADGLARGASRSLGREDSEQLAAVASGFHSLARGVGRHFDTGGVRQTLVELDDAFLVVASAGSGSCLALFAESGADLGQVGYEMTLLVKRVGPHLSTAPRVAPPDLD